MKVTDTQIKEVKIIEPKIFNDERGFFYEVINTDSLRQSGIDFIPVQENCAFSLLRNTIRGLHYQDSPHAQAKLIRCTKGRVLDFAIDLRKDSDTYKKFVRVELSFENKKQLYIPKGFAHGVLSLEDNSEISYFVDEFFCVTSDRSIAYNDLEINIDWGVDNVIVSEKDRIAPTLYNSKCSF